MKKLDPKNANEIYKALVDEKAYILLPHPDGSGHSMNSLFDMNGNESDFAKIFKEEYPSETNWIKSFAKDLYKGPMSIFLP